MKKIFTTLFLCSAFAVQAQYLPNSSFDNWKSACGSTDAVSSMDQRPGVEPMDWNGSSVNQMGMKKQLVFNDGGRVKLQNAWVGLFGIGSTAPGYITLGTPAVPTVVSHSAINPMQLQAVSRERIARMKIHILSRISGREHIRRMWERNQVPTSRETMSTGLFWA